jgi:hypothetical protein
MPRAYGNFILALIPLILSGGTNANHLDTIDKVSKFAYEHLEKTTVSRCEAECIFMTERGFLGRTVVGKANSGDIVAFLQGGWTPYILNKKREFFSIESFAFVEGLSHLKSLAPGSKIERICLK